MLPEPGPALTGLAGAPRRFHIVGIGGAGMNAIATVLRAMGHEVSGSDLQASPVLERLERLGVRTFVGHDAAHVGAAEIVAFSTAVKPDNVELVEARQRGAACISRAGILGAICRTRRALAVSGTHGKTSTTAMLAQILVRAGLEPGYMVGGEVRGAEGGASWGKGPWLVVEADESDGTFLRLGAEGVVVTNVEADHLDHYGSEEALARAFQTFVEQAPGPRVVCLDDPGAAALAAAVPGVTTYGASPRAAFRIDRAELLSSGGASFDVSERGRALGSFELAVPGLHNVRNAVAALAAAAEIGVDPDAAREALAAYAGVGRRFELRGSRDGVTYVDDYAHLPTEVRATLAAARQGKWKRVVAVFQPHRYSRTAALGRDFGAAFDGADLVVVTGIYPAGEEAVPGISGLVVADAVRASAPGLRVEYAETRQEVVATVRGLLQPGDLCLTMGAGDLTTLADELLVPVPGNGARSWEGRA
ncbi:MAG: UDP-N-acetylmuramate--L-alanine ligase [Acidimicrobiales bacterium]